MTFDPRIHELTHIQVNEDGTATPVYRLRPETVELPPLAESLAMAWERARANRRKLLADCDWTDTLSAKARLGDELYDAWQTYRQALRDITSQPDPFALAWPSPPA